MWIFLNNAFLSVVKDRHSDDLLVRARLKGDLERLFPYSAVTELPHADYRFRTHVSQAGLAIELWLHRRGRK